MTFDDWITNVGVAVAAESDILIPNGRHGNVFPVQGPVPVAVISQVSLVLIFMLFFIADSPLQDIVFADASTSL